MSIVESGCCCDGSTTMYLAVACFPSRSRGIGFSNPDGADLITTFNGTIVDSTNPPAGTEAIVWMVGAGGGSNTTDAIGGAGAILEKQITLPSSSTVKVGQGGFGGTGTVSSVLRVFGRGAKGAANSSSEGKSYGGGATGWTGAGGMIAGGGGGAGSSEFFTQYGTDANGGDAGIASAIDPCLNTGCGNGANGVTPGTGGTLGNQAAASPGQGGTGSSQSSGVAGAGGGGGGFAGGGRGTNTAGTPPVYGGGPGGGGNSVGYTVGTSEAGLNGQTQQNSVSATAGDGGIDAQGNDGYLEFLWRTCEDCQCPEAATGLPPALYICLNQQQYDAIVAAASPCEFDTGQEYIVFRYLDFPYMLQHNPFGENTTSERPCTRTVLTEDIDTENSHYVDTVDSCCEITGAALFNESCTSACIGQCPEGIYLCNKYLEEIGVPMCRDPSKFYKIDYLGCIYELSGTTTNYNCLAEKLDNLNVGTYGGVFDEPPVQYTYQVGPFPFLGGFTCCSGFGVSMSIDWSGVVNSTQYSDVCCDGYAMFPLYESNPGGSSATFELACNNYPSFTLTTEPNCYGGGSSPCNCDNQPCSTANPSYDAIGLCNPDATDPCASAKTKKSFSAELQLTGNPGSGGFVCLILTRATASSGTSWASCDPINGIIYIDDCVFIGSGHAGQFAKVINDSLEDCVIASAPGGLAWLGNRCCTLTPTTCAPCRGGSDDWVLSSISTTEAIFKASYTVWATLEISYSHLELSCRVCGGYPCENVAQCCAGDGYLCGATWYTEVVPEQYGVTPSGGDFNPVVLISDGCAFASPPVSGQGGGNVVLS